MGGRVEIVAWIRAHRTALIVLVVIVAGLWTLQQVGFNVPIWSGCTADLDKCSSIIALGLFQGMIISLIALGYTLVYGILQLINFANGDVFMLGSVMTLLGVQIVGLKSDSPPLSVILTFAVLLPVTMLLMAGLNASIERLAYRPLRRAPTLATLISAIGMSFILQNVGQKIIGPSPVSLPNLLPTNNIIGPGGLLEIGTLEIKVSHLFVTLVTLPLLFGLMWFVRSTRQGKAMRATAQDREAAGLMGIDVNRTITLTFLLAGALAGGAGIVVALYNGSAWWFYGTPYGLLAFTAAVLGGIGNLLGAAIGGILLGILISLNAFYFEQRWQEIFVFGILVMILVFRPTGLLAEKQSERA
jgi:branched-chain amino acid transport system permease protein